MAPMSFIATVLYMQASTLSISILKNGIFADGLKLILKYSLIQGNLCSGGEILFARNRKYHPYFHFCANSQVLKLLGFCLFLTELPSS